MFSANEKISGRQAFRLLVFDLLGLGTLLIPTAVAGFCGRDGIFCILAGTILGLLFLRLMIYAVKDMQGSFADYTEQVCGTPGGKLIQAGYLCYLVLLAGYTAYLFSTIVLKNLLREESFYLVLVLILGMVWYGLRSGIEGRARVYELLFWLLLVPLFLMLASALDDVKTDYWSPIFFTDKKDFFAGSYYVFICCSFVFLVLFLKGYMRNHNSLKKAGRMALIFTGCLEAGLYLILLGVFGEAALAKMSAPAITLMSAVKITGGFLKRADAFMFGIWFFTLYALLNSAVFYAETLLNGFWKRNRKNEPWFVWRRAAVLLLVFLLAVFFYQSQEAEAWYENFLWYLGTPFLVFVPLLLALIRYHKERNQKQMKRHVHLGQIVCLLCSLLGMSGCAAAELEERNFPIEMAVSSMEEFDREWLNLDESGNRMTDYSHMKVIVLDKEFLEDAQNMDAFLELLEHESDVPRNTYVVAAEDAEAILKLQSELGESVGTYLEDYFEHVSEIKKTAYPTLGMLYQEQENQTETLLIPYVEEQEKKPVVTNYYVWKYGKAAGLIDNQTAMLSFFTQNQMEEYTLRLENGMDIRLFAPHNQIRFSKTEEKQVIAELQCSGEILYAKQRTQQEAVLKNKQHGAGYSCQVNREMIQSATQQIASYVQQTASQADMDCANSYKKLGGARRDWYQRYRGTPNQYEADIELVYQMQIDWVH